MRWKRPEEKVSVSAVDMTRWKRRKQAHIISVLSVFWEDDAIDTTILNKFQGPTTSH